MRGTAPGAQRRGAARHGHHAVSPCARGRAHPLQRLPLRLDTTDRRHHALPRQGRGSGRRVPVRPSEVPPSPLGGGRWRWCPSLTDHRDPTVESARRQSPPQQGALPPSPEKPMPRAAHILMPQGLSARRWGWLPRLGRRHSYLPSHPAQAPPQNALPCRPCRRSSHRGNVRASGERVSARPFARAPQRQEFPPA